MAEVIGIVEDGKYQSLTEPSRGFSIRFFKPCLSLPFRATRCR